MKVSVIIPVYNVSPYISRCLDSVVAQTNTDLECILVDDCGTDNSIKIVLQFISEYKGAVRFSVLHHYENQGLSAARNSGIKAASGEYIYFLDSDNAIMPNCIETLTALAAKYPEADFVQGSTIRETEKLMNNWSKSDLPEYCDNKNELSQLILQRSYRTAWNKLIKRDFIIKHSLYFPVGLIMEDHYWTWYLAKNVNAVAFTNKGTYFYYLNKDSIVNSSTKTMRIRRYTSYLKIAHSIASDLFEWTGSLKCQRMYVGEAFVSALEDVARIHSVWHWLRFWTFICQSSWKWRKKCSWGRIYFLLCLLPPPCFLTLFKGWRWRLRQNVLSKI